LDETTLPFDVNIMSEQTLRRDREPPAQLNIDLAARFIAEAGLTETEFAGQGLDCVVYRGISKEYNNSRVALKVSKHKIITNANDPDIPARDQLNQELRIYELLHGTAVPVPKPYRLFEIDGHPAMISEFIDDDQSAISPEELARVVSLIHSVEIPQDWGVRLIADERTDGLTALRHRVSRRFKKLIESEPSIEDLIPEEQTLQRLSDQLRRSPTCLNHMDLDDVNFRVREGRIIGVIDWSNAVLGPAAVDICRILELGSKPREFADACRRIGSYPEMSDEEETFLRLDSALMLALVFIWEAPNPQGRVTAVERVRELAKTLQNR
jgi:aminoglycoside phosphotransferase (APT) family kinase protein